MGVRVLSCPSVAHVPPNDACTSQCGQLQSVAIGREMSAITEHRHAVGMGTEVLRCRSGQVRQGRWRPRLKDGCQERKFNGTHAVNLLANVLVRAPVMRGEA